MSECHADDAYVKAHEKRLIVVKPKQDELLLDIDNTADMVHMSQMFAMLEEKGIEVEIVREAPSAGGNRHVTLKIKVLFKQSDFATGPGLHDLDHKALDVTRIALEAALGSDRKRALLGLLTVLLEKPGTPSCFFEKPADASDDDIRRQRQALVAACHCCDSDCEPDPDRARDDD